MNTYKEVQGDLIQMALSGEFDVITHGCNCFCTMGAGIAPKMAKEFECNNFEMELSGKGDINKLGQLKPVAGSNGSLQQCSVLSALSELR